MQLTFLLFFCIIYIIITKTPTIRIHTRIQITGVFIMFILLFFRICYLLILRKFFLPRLTTIPSPSNFSSGIVTEISGILSPPRAAAPVRAIRMTASGHGDRACGVVAGFTVGNYRTTYKIQMQGGFCRVDRKSVV